MHDFFKQKLFADGGVTRREFIKVAVATGVIVSAIGPEAFAQEKKAEMIYRPLGSTGRESLYDWIRGISHWQSRGERGHQDHAVGDRSWHDIHG